MRILTVCVALRLMEIVPCAVTNGNGYIFFTSYYESGRGFAAAYRPKNYKSKCNPYLTYESKVTYKAFKILFLKIIKGYPF